MNPQDNKRIVEDFLGEFDNRNVPKLLGMMTDDATWWVNGNPELFSGARTHSKPEIAKVWQSLFDGLRGGLAMRSVSMIAEHDRVAAEVTCHATTKSGRDYENDYNFVFVVRDGRIAGVREYTDLLHAAETFA